MQLDGQSSSVYCSCLWYIKVHLDFIARYMPMLVFHNNFVPCKIFVHAMRIVMAED